jgi:hypothetical protein
MYSAVAHAIAFTIDVAREFRLSNERRENENERGGRGRRGRGEGGAVATENK